MSLHIFHFLSSGLAFFFGIMSSASLVFHERKWWRMRHWLRVQGTIVGVSKDPHEPGVYRPEIKYQNAGTTIQFIPEFASPEAPAIGESVPVLIGPNGETSQHISTANRWLPTLILTTLALACLGGGIYFLIEGLERYANRDSFYGID